MLRKSLSASAVLILAGCLSTPEPVFDASNSRPVGDIPEFLAFADAWEGYVDDGGSPRELIAEGTRGVVIDGIVVVQERTDYYALGMFGGRPISCVVFADKGIEDDAAAFGVTVQIVKQDEETSIDDAPALVEADGPPEALVAFIRDQFANQRIACIGNPRG